MIIKLFYFSQSGNTYKIGKAINEAFIAQGHSSCLIAIDEKINIETIKPFDVIGIGSPCFSSRTPTPVKEFINKLPKMKNKPFFIFATAGGAPGNLIYEVTNLLKNKGAYKIGEIITYGEIYFPAPCLNGQNKGKPDDEDIENVIKFAHLIINKLSRNKSSRLDVTLKKNKRITFYRFIGLLCNDKLLRIILAKPKIYESKCIKCTTCIKECPLNNISIDEAIVIGNNCIRCYRCQVVCKQNAYDATNWFFSNILIWLLYNKKFKKWFGNMNIEEGN